jgi:hypothetical protein
LPFNASSESLSMLTLSGTLRAAVVLPARTDKKSGEVYPARPTLQIEGQDARGLVQLFSLTVPDIAAYADKLGQVVSLPVRAWAPGATVGFSYADSK